MPKLFIANVRSDYAESVRASSGLAGNTRRGSDTAARFIWHMEDDDILLSPDEPEPGYVEYVCRILGTRSAQIHVLHSKQALSDQYLSSSEIAERLRLFVADPDSWKLEPFLLTSGVIALAEELGCKPPPGADFAMSGELARLNTKSGFRAQATAATLPVARGTTVCSADEAERVVSSLLARTSSVIVKHERGGGGRGNIGITTDSGSGLRGTRVTYFLDDEPGALISEIWAFLSEGVNSSAVVEEYIEGGVPFYTEWCLSSEGVQYVASGEICYQSPGTVGAVPQWTGLRLPASGAITTSALALNDALAFMQHLQEIGFRGFANLDGLAFPDRSPIYQEVNARWGGGLVVADIANRLFGSSWAQEYCLKTVLDLPAADFRRLESALHSVDVLYERGDAEGVLILGANSDLGSGCELLLVAASQARLEALERRVRSLFESF